MSNFKFPDNFKWGVSTAGHQIEGGNVNSESWVIEHLPDTIYAEPSGDACDHYHLYAEDTSLFADLGLNAFRLSIEWARIEPEEGEFSNAALEHYRRVLESCRDNGISPMVTFHHFISPKWLMKDGSWLSPKTVDRYARYIDKASSYLGDLIDFACTFNEPNIARILDRVVPFPIRNTPFWKNAAEAFGVSEDKLGLWQFVIDPAMWDIIYDAHKKAVDILHSGPGAFPAGMSIAMTDIQAAPGGEEVQAQFRQELIDDFLDRLSGEDYIGVQTYSRMVVGPEGLVRPGADAEITQMHEEFYPEALEPTIRHAAAKTGSPVIVTENGVALDDDSRRVEYLRRAIRGVANCIRDGIDVRGYYCWSAFDNFEWISGYGPKFGIIGVDRDTMKRTPKPSANYLGSIAKENAIDL